MIIETYRADGLRQGNPITELLLSDAALIHRGTAEMDANAHNLVQVNMDVVFRPGLRLGQLIAASDPATARPYRAKITGIQITASPGSIDTRLTLEQPL